MAADGSIFDDAYLVRILPGHVACPGCGVGLVAGVALAAGPPPSPPACPRCGAALTASLTLPPGAPASPVQPLPFRRTKAPEGEPPGA